MAINIYINVPDSDLIYFGDDPIVWDRVNAERLRRGLPPLSNPRPTGDEPNVSVPRASSAAAADELRQAESRRESLIRQIGNVENVKFVNEQTLRRKQAELATVTNPADRAVIQSQINQLNTVVAQQDAKLGPLESQLTQVDQQVSSALASAFPGAQFLPKLPALPSLPNLSGLPVSLAVNPGDLLKQLPSSASIPGLDAAQVTGMLAATAATVTATARAAGQSSTAVVKTVNTAASNISDSVGVGEFGITATQLQQQGYLKPGTVESFVAPSTSINQVSTVLSSPTVWTGKDAVTSATAFSANPSLQNITQQNILTQGADQLRSLGTISGTESAQQLAGAVQNAGKFGADTAAAWAKGQAPTGLVTSLNDTAKNAEFAANLAGKIPDLGAITPPVEGAVGTVNRASVNTAVAGLLGNPKIPLPNFGGVG
jgi:hypothetical protein